MKNDRKAIWVDRFQTRLLYRIGVYLAIYLLCLANLLFIWRLLAEGPGNPIDQFLRVLSDFAPAFLGLAILLPIVAYDALRFSHRLVGPLVRFRRTMEEIAQGDTVRPMKLRDGDFLIDMRDEFNKMLEELQKRGVPVLRALDDEDKQSA
ncbi:MAG: hypothetical protein L0215_24230 [Gemmataceae bacterium]|nr:hypothetical protein [Gemmataceae bacterium]